jgi:peptidoglycan/LPS O-acetylase OafA/YrhL
VGHGGRRWLLERRRGDRRRDSRGAAPLAALGRWSLSFYMLHQPILIGLLLALIWLRR